MFSTAIEAGNLLNSHATCHRFERGKDLATEPLFEEKFDFDLLPKSMGGGASTTKTGDDGQSAQDEYCCANALGGKTLSAFLSNLEAGLEAGAQEN